MTNLLQVLGEWISNPLLENPIVHYAGIVGMALLGIVYCLYGYKLMRVLGTVICAGIGCIAGYVIASLVNLQFPVNAVVIVVCAIIFGLLAFFLRRVGEFVAVFFGVWSVVFSLLAEYTAFDKVVLAIISIVSGLVLAILSVIYKRVVIIIATALAGGMMFSNELFEHLIQIRWDSSIEMYARLGLGLLLAVIGIIFQFLKTRKKKV